MCSHWFFQLRIDTCSDSSNRYHLVEMQKVYLSLLSSLADPLRTAETIGDDAERAKHSGPALCR